MSLCSMLHALSDTHTTHNTHTILNSIESSPAISTLLAGVRVENGPEVTVDAKSCGYEVWVECQHSIVLHRNMLHRYPYSKVLVNIQ